MDAAGSFRCAAVPVTPPPFLVSGRTLGCRPPCCRGRARSRRQMRPHSPRIRKVGPRSAGHLVVAVLPRPHPRLESGKAPWVSVPGCRARLTSAGPLLMQLHYTKSSRPAEPAGVRSPRPKSMPVPSTSIFRIDRPPTGPMWGMPVIASHRTVAAAPCQPRRVKARLGFPVIASHRACGAMAWQSRRELSWSRTRRPARGRPLHEERLSDAAAARRAAVFSPRHPEPAPGGRRIA